MNAHNNVAQFHARFTETLCSQGLAHFDKQWYLGAMLCAATAAATANAIAAVCRFGCSSGDGAAWRPVLRLVTGIADAIAFGAF